MVRFSPLPPYHGAWNLTVRCPFRLSTVPSTSARMPQVLPEKTIYTLAPVTANFSLGLALVQQRTSQKEQAVGE